MTVKSAAPLLAIAAQRRATIAVNNTTAARQ
jgi:hypothetical protein